MNRKIIVLLLILAIVALAAVPQASAFPRFLTAFEGKYGPAVNGSRIDNCNLCHVGPNPAGNEADTPRNPYGLDFAAQPDHAANPGPALTAIEPLDSDKDGFINIDEIHNLTFPGNASDFPSKIISATPNFNISGFKMNSATSSGISGWNITLKNSTMQTSMLTLSDGSYKFGNLVNGSYNVTEETKSGFTNVTPTTVEVDIAGSDMMNINFTNAPISAANRTFVADLTGGEEVPPVVTLARGNATFNLSDDGTVLHFKVTVANITNATLSHIHLAPVGVSGPIVVTLFTGPTKTGRFDGVLAEGDIMQADLSGPLAGQSLSALLDNMTAGNTYVNVHTTQHPAGEIRGQIRVAPAPNARFSISGFKVNNVTNSGIQGWNITLRNGTTNALIDSKPTDTNGFYQFIVLVNGSYNVSEETRADFTPVGATFQSVTIAGQDIMNVNFTNTPVAVKNGSIAGMKFNDMNNNGTKDAGEPGLANWQINLTKPDGSITNMMTDGNGNYNFTNLPAGTYTVSETLKAGWMQTFPASPGTYSVTLAAGQNVVGKDFGNFQPVVVQNGSIAGMKFNDMNNNGVKDAGEPGLENWQINLTKPDGSIKSMFTDEDGNYNFTDLAAGTYMVSETLQAGWTQTFPASPGTYSVTLAAGENVAGKDFGNFKPVVEKTNTISGFKINDLNGNDRQDAGEAGLPGWNIRLIGIGPETFQVNRETTTDDNGFYEFEDLPAGMYIVVENLKGGFVPSGSPVIVVNLEKGKNSMNNNFMNRPISSLIPDLSGLSS